MTFDKTKPVEDTEADAKEVRDNFNALATDHAGTTEPPAPEAGYTWLDTTDVGNLKVKRYNGSAWVVEAEHIEGTPTHNADQLQARPVLATAPSNGQVLTWNGSSWAPADGGGGGGGLGLHYGNYLISDPTGAAATTNLSVGPQSQCRMVTRAFWAFEPYSGGLFGVRIDQQINLHLYQRDDFVQGNLDADYDAVNGWIRLSMSGNCRVYQLGAAAPQGQNYVDINVGFAYPNSYGAWLADAANNREYHIIDSIQPNTPSSGWTRWVFKTPIAKVGGYQINDEVTGIIDWAQNSTRGYADVSGDSEFHMQMELAGIPGFPLLGLPWKTTVHIDYFGA